MPATSRFMPALICIMCIMVTSCHNKRSSNIEMAESLRQINIKESVPDNPFCPQAALLQADSMLNVATNNTQMDMANYYKAITLLQLGRESEAVSILQALYIGATHPATAQLILKALGIAYMRIGERSNCIAGHAGASCVFPIKGAGIHSHPAGSQKAIEIFQRVLQTDTGDLESRWLLNIAYMTLGTYPAKVPKAWLIPGLDIDTLSPALRIQPFEDQAPQTGLDINNMAGGSLVEDMDNDGNLDIVNSGWDLTDSMHYMHSNGDGTFTDQSFASGLQEITGGLNILQTDYNNDGLKDIFVMRGAWKGIHGQEPFSLLKNNGDGTFTDVTRSSGLWSLQPTQTATWADFNNDGWLDVFVGAESTTQGVFPCRLYLNNRDGTFTETAVKAGCDVKDFVKGVVSADYNNDGWPDIFISCLTGEKILLRNDGLKDGTVHFTNTSAVAGLQDNKEHTFATWFFDYDNDGWEDIVICNSEFQKSLAVYAAAEALHRRTGREGEILLYRNNHDGTFTNVTDATGLNHTVFAMGANFGDIDNDGYLDMYFGTGNPLYQSLVPNKLFRNQEGRKFIDVTSSGRVGNLQKGHGVSFADLDNDGDVDIYLDMGGSYIGDAYPNILYVNPGQLPNHWIDIKVEGVRCNRAAIGARIKLSITEDNGKHREVYKDVNSGGSFGANPLSQHIGIGKATRIDSLQITWPGSKHQPGETQLLTGIGADQFIAIRQGSQEITHRTVKTFSFGKGGAVSCTPPPHPSSH